MNATIPYRATSLRWFLRAFGLLSLVFFLTASGVHAQNTKGDRPASARESRFKTPTKAGKQKRKKTSTRRVRSKQKSVAARASGGRPRRATGKDRPGKPLRPIYQSKPSKRERAWTGDIAGRRIRTKSPAGRSRANVYPQRGPYVHNPSPKPRKRDRPVSNRGTLAELKQLQSRPHPTATRKQQKVVPRSASGSYIARKSINVYASFPRKKRKGEQATTKDIAGRKLRRKNYETPRPGVIKPILKPYAGRKMNRGDRPYKATPGGGYISATRAGRPWKGDLSGKRLRMRNFSSKKSVEGNPVIGRKGKPRGRDKPAVKGGWHVTATQSGEKRAGKRPLEVRSPGIGANGIDKYQGHVRGGRPLKGGGSVSGSGWNNNGRPIEVRRPSQGAGIARYQGNLKVGRPAKGGGSVSGRLWNNNERPLEVRTPKQGAGVARFQGNIKANRPAKGGGSVSGRLWNNRETPIPGRTPPASAREVDGYPLKIKRFEVQPGFGDQGETFTGYVKLRRLRKNYVQNPNANDESILKKRPNKGLAKADGLQVKVKQPNYVRNKNAAEEALLKTKPTKSTFQAGELQVKVREKQYANKPHAADGALPGIKPTKSSVKASEYARSVKRDWDYVRNPSSAEEALKTREPGKAFARASDYQGNIKMRKYVLFEKNRALHPDAKFIKTNKNNVDEERDALTNFKLWWAKLFKKQETQPEHLKYKGKKPRYDKGEDGLWYE